MVLKRSNLTEHATLSDVAREAGVGVATASRVINGSLHVSPETLKRVQAVIERLGYQPNHAARTLKGASTKTVGLLVPSIADSFFSSCAEAAQRVASTFDTLLIVISSHNDLKAEMESLNALVQRRVDGLLLAPASSSNREIAAMLGRTSIPVVAFDRPLHRSGIPSVLTNNYRGTKEAVQHLIQHGYRRILCLGGERNLYTIQERIRGYRAAVTEAGLPCLIDVSITDEVSAERALETHLKQANPPDAIFTLKNFATIHTFEALRRMKISVPDRVALLGFDDFELASTLRPSISVVRQPVAEIGRAAAHLLFERMDHSNRKKERSGDAQEMKPIQFSTELVLRRSCGCADALDRDD